MLLGVGQDIKAIGLGHLQIEKKHRIGAGFEQLKCGLAVGGFVDFVTVGLKENAQCISLFVGIIADQKARPGIDLGVVLFGDLGLHE